METLTVLKELNRYSSGRYLVFCGSTTGSFARKEDIVPGDTLYFAGSTIENHAGKEADSWQADDALHVEDDLGNLRIGMRFIYK
jgi:hypothetical protein